MKRASWLGLALLAGCATATTPVGVVPSGPELALTRSRYVLPPEPPPPEPRSVEDQRRLEAEWPEVKTFTVTSWPHARDRAERLHLAGDPGWPHPPRGDVHSARPIHAQPVIVRVQNRRADTLPMILLEVN